MKNIIVFMSILLTLTVSNLFIVDKEMSELERRPLEQFPEISFETLFSGEFSKNFSVYVSDQFIGRDFFRSVKTGFQINFLNRTENNDVYVKDGNIYEKFDEIDYDLIDTHIRNINRFIDELDVDVYLSLIPSKSFGLDLPNIDQEVLASYISNNIDAIYLDQLDYYKGQDEFLVSDPHWTQKTAMEVYKNYLQSHLIRQASNSDYVLNMDDEIYQGTLYSSLGTGRYSDILEFYTNEVIENLNVCINNGTITCQSGPYYEDTESAYDLFLNGNHPIVVIENNEVEGKELVVFRDSFSNAIAPFIAEDYSKVTLVDLRLVRIEYIKQIVDFANADVLYLYNLKTFNDDFRLTN